MTTDTDIYRTANILVKERGAPEAEIEAAQRADAFLEAGDMNGRSVWLRILDAVRELSDKTPSSNRTMH